MLMTIVILALCVALPVLGIAHIAELRRRERAEREAIESERRFRRLAECSFDMIVRFDPRTQQRTYISPACRRLYGYEPEEALAMSAEEIIHPEDLPKVREVMRRLERADQAPITYRGRRKDGTYIWVEASLTRSSNLETGTMEAVSVVRDISERVRYEAALRQADASLTDVVRVLYIVPNGAEFQSCWPVLRRYFGESRPAATMIAAGLIDPRMRIEIEVTARRQARS